MKVIQTNFNYVKPLVPLVLEKVLWLVLHHADAKIYTPEQCHADHLKNGWSGAGYNEFIRKDGTVYILRGDHIGAQCGNNNSKTYGICCEGDYGNENEMPQVQYNTLLERLKFHKNRFKNLIGIKPHGYFNNTSCPGKYFPTDRIIAAVYSENKSVTFEQAIEIIKQIEITNSPDYWLKNAVIGGTVNGEFAGKLIINTANKLKQYEDKLSSDSAAKKGVVSATTLNIRNKPSIDGKVVDALEKGAEITITEAIDDWYRIGPGRWVHSLYVKTA